VGLIPFQRGWDIIDLSVGLIIRCVGFKLNCGVYVRQLTWGFLFNSRGRRLRIPIFIVGFDELN